MSTTRRRTSRPPLRIPGKTVYLLGSGFSAGCGIPTIAQFVSSGLGILKGHALKARHAERARITTLLRDIEETLDRYQPMLGQLCAAEPNLEEYFCAIDAVGSEADVDRSTLVRFVSAVCRVAVEERIAAKELARKKHRYQLPPDSPVKCVSRQSAWSGTRHYVPIQSFEVDHEPRACIYEAFLSQVFVEAQVQRANHHNRAAAQPAIVSLNYDLVLEKTLGALQQVKSIAHVGWRDRGFHYGEGFTDQPARKLSVDLVKIHGSLNWLQDAHHRWKVCKRPHDGSAKTMIMPTWVRTLDTSLRGKLIDNALRHLRTAEQIVVIGYSMPGTDKYLRYLIARALGGVEQPRICICSRFATWAEAETAGRDMFGRQANLVAVPPMYECTAFIESRHPPTELVPAKERRRHSSKTPAARRPTSTVTQARK